MSTVYGALAKGWIVHFFDVDANATIVVDVFPVDEQAEAIAQAMSYVGLRDD